MSSAALDAWKNLLVAKHTTALLVMRDDKVIYEWYAKGHGPDRNPGTSSLAARLFASVI